MHILLVEDDVPTAAYAARGFKEAGHVVDVLANGREAMVQCLQADYDVLVVDRMLPGMDGLSLVKSLRTSGIRSPVIFLTAVSGVDDRVAGLEALAARLTGEAVDGAAARPQA
jgi:two-component system OmpR family response regulator